jgi:GTP cyclohydrolase I
VYEVSAQRKLEVAAEQLLKALGYSLEDQHFQLTPTRMATWLETFAANGDDDIAAAMLDVQFDEEHDSLVAVGPITYQSMCAHHALPVTGDAWVGYIPQKHVVGLSKLARLVHYYAQQFTVQERVTQQVANLLHQKLDPLGVMVVIRAEHGCMTLRGVKEPRAITTTSAVRGVFKNEPDARMEFLTFMSEKGKG